MNSSPQRAGGVLTIDLGKIQANYNTLQKKLGSVPCSAVVKADAYGLGAIPVAKALWDAGCRTFWVVHVDEGIELRNALPSEAEIHLLIGAFKGAEEDIAAHRLIPVLSSLGDIERWNAYQTKKGRQFACDLQIDTGMTRLGLPPYELQAIAEDASLIANLNVAYVMTHLACADEPDHPLNQTQRDNFKQARQIIPQGKASFANSSGIFHGPVSHFDLGRPGCALYGINPTPDHDNPMEGVIHLQAKVVQVHKIDTDRTVGYGATHKAKPGQKIACLALGYADGYLRSLSSRATVYLDGTPCPVTGRVSMDLISIDVSAIPDERLELGRFVDVIGPHHDADALAKDAGTIGYEILTSLGSRYHRIYKG